MKINDWFVSYFISSTYLINLYTSKLTRAFVQHLLLTMKQRLILNQLILICCLLIAFGSTAQKGDFILTHHTPKHSEVDNVNFEIITDNNGIICVANRFGVLKYDGMNWDFYPTNSSALSLTTASDNTLYVGCLGEFGKIDYLDNAYQYVPLLESDSLTDHFLQTFSISDTIYFLSDHHLFQYIPSGDQVQEILQGSFYNGYVYAGILYLNSTDKGTIKIRHGEVLPASKNEHTWGMLSASPNGKHQYAVDLNGHLFHLQDGEFKPHKQMDRLKEAQVVITDLQWVTDKLIVCSTIESGVFFLDAEAPDYFEVTDYHSGLPDNETFDIFADNNGGVWVAHEFGLTRIDPLFPASSYTNIPGLEGNLIEAQRIHGELWVNTSLGVFYFAQDTMYRSRVYIEKVSKEKSQTAKRTTTTDPAEATEPEEKGFLKGLFRRKDRVKETENPEEEKKFLKKVFSSKSTKEEDNEEYIRRVEKIVTGVTNQFNHVPGSDGKFRQLMEAQDRILATSHTGIYEISKKSADLVINEPIQYACLVPESNQLLISTEYGAVKQYQLTRNIWREVSSQTFEDVILNVYMDSHDLVWLAGTTHIYQGAFENKVFTIQHSYEINNRFYDELSIWEHSNTLYFINSQGYFRLDRASEHIVADQELEKELGTPHHHLHNEKSRVWLYNGQIWNLLNPDGSVEKFNYLGVFPNLKYINYDEELNRYWLITEDNQLLAYNADQDIDLAQSNGLFIKRLTSHTGELRLKKSLKLAYDQNTLSIELLKPDYLGFLNPEYQYLLKGLNEEWSPWTQANLIDYSYLPSGDYEFMVRVRDALGQLVEASLLEFTVATPYWQQPWFYAIQVLFLAMIVVITSRLDESKNHNYIIKHGLSILTLVVIIEFLQSVIGGYLDIKSTPVVDFLVDAGIAILIFPLEWLLRKLFLEGKVKISRKNIKPAK